MSVTFTPFEIVAENVAHLLYKKVKNNAKEELLGVIRENSARFNNDQPCLSFNGKLIGKTPDGGFPEIVNRCHQDVRDRLRFNLNATEALEVEEAKIMGYVHAVMLRFRAPADIKELFPERIYKAIELAFLDLDAWPDERADPLELAEFKDNHEQYINMMKQRMLLNTIH